MMRWPAPAKLNLFLHITGRREDGYHELQTLFQFIDLIDWLSFTPNGAGEISRSQGMVGVAAEDDLVVRAARLLQRVTATSAGVDIAVEKQIPAGGGLGGGSSDAATTLVALNQIWGCGLSLRELAELGVALGADVPVFVRGTAAWAEGVGEQITEVSPPEPWYLVVAPEVAVSTAEIFRSKELTRNTPKAKIRGSLPDGGRNDCESVVVKRYPEVGTALRWLSRFGDARMTGTGSCLFVALQSRAEAAAVWQQLPTQWQGFVVRGMNRSPLVDAVKREHSGVV